MKPLRELDKVVEDFLSPTNEELTFPALLEMVEKEFVELQDLLQEKRLTGRGKELSSRHRKKMMIAWDGIPEIAISEIGFSDAATTASGAGISGPGRKALERWARRLGAGGDLSRTVKNMTDFYSGGIAEISRSDLSHGRRIARILAHLTIYKTLTKIVNEFNASSAGFSFESFVAVLLGGTQVETGQNSIADLDAKGTPWSLKLYAEKAVKAGGSYSQLVDDLSGRGSIYYEEEGVPAMKYLVVEKTLEGEGLDQEGQLRWTTFTFTLNNIMTILQYADPESKEAIRLPVNYGSEEFTHALAQATRDKAELGASLQDRFIEEIRQALADEDAQEVEAFVAFLSDLPRNKLKDKSGAPLAKRVYSKKNWPAQWEGLRELVRNIDGKVNSEYAAVATGSEKRNLVSKIEWMSPADSAVEYAKLSDPEAKMEALKHTYGILGPKRAQFEVRRGQLRDTDFLATANGQDLGTVPIGTKYVAEMLNAARAELDESIFEIFSEMKRLKDNIEAYFAGGLENDNRAQGAIENTETIAGKTEELRDK
mgnify:CR=1 FL=1